VYFLDNPYGGFQKSPANAGAAATLLTVLSGKPSGSHKIEGTGAGFVVPLWTSNLADEIKTVSSQEAMATARRLAREEGIFAGTSTGANVAAALRMAERLGPGHTIVTIAMDSGMKYVSTPLYSSS
jgi:cysteine synthase A